MSYEQPLSGTVNSHLQKSGFYTEAASAVLSSRTSWKIILEALSTATLYQLVLTAIIEIKRWKICSYSFIVCTKRHTFMLCR
jgi:hypothetical protein